MQPCRTGQDYRTTAHEQNIHDGRAVACTGGSSWSLELLLLVNHEAGQYQARRGGGGMIRTISLKLKGAPGLSRVPQHGAYDRRPGARRQDQAFGSYLCGFAVAGCFGPVICWWCDLWSLQRRDRSASRASAPFAFGFAVCAEMDGRCRSGTGGLVPSCE